MIIFAVDSSSASGSAAIWKDGTVLAESFCNVGLTHSETLMPLCDEVFRRSGIAPSEVDLYAVTGGPGSFTGLRIGMGIVKGLAFPTNAACAAVPTTEALAFGVCPTDRTVVSVLDARQKRVYAAAYDCSGTVPAPLFEDEVLTYDELAERFCEKKILLVGDAARLCYNTLSGKADVLLAADSNLYVHAACVAAAAKVYFDRGAVCGCAELAPKYIQMPQAERERLAREKQEAKQ